MDFKTPNPGSVLNKDRIPASTAELASSSHKFTSLWTSKAARLLDSDFPIETPIGKEFEGKAGKQDVYELLRQKESTAAPLIQSHQHGQGAGLAIVAGSPEFGLDDDDDPSGQRSKKIRTSRSSPSFLKTLGVQLNQQQSVSHVPLKSGASRRKKRVAVLGNSFTNQNENIVPLEQSLKKQPLMQTFFSNENMATTEEPFILGAPVSNRGNCQEMNPDFLSAYELDEARRATEIANNPPLVINTLMNHSSVVLQRMQEYLESNPQIPTTPVMDIPAVIPPPSRQRVKRYAERVPISLEAPLGPDGLPSIRSKTPKLVRTTRKILDADSQQLNPNSRLFDEFSNHNQKVGVDKQSTLGRKSVSIEEIKRIADSAPPTPGLQVSLEVGIAHSCTDASAKSPGLSAKSVSVVKDTILEDTNLASLDDQVGQNITIGERVKPLSKSAAFSLSSPLRQNLVKDTILEDTNLVSLDDQTEQKIGERVTPSKPAAFSFSSPIRQNLVNDTILDTNLASLDEQSGKKIAIGERVKSLSKPAAFSLSSPLRKNLFDTASVPDRFLHDDEKYVSLQFDIDDDIGDSCPARVGSGVSQEMMFNSMNRSPTPLEIHSKIPTSPKSSPSIKFNHGSFVLETSSFPQDPGSNEEYTSLDLIPPSTLPNPEKRHATSDYEKAKSFDAEEDVAIPDNSEKDMQHLVSPVFSLLPVQLEEKEERKDSYDELNMSHGGIVQESADMLDCGNQESVDMLDDGHVQLSVDMLNDGNDKESVDMLGGINIDYSSPRLTIKEVLLVSSQSAQKDEENIICAGDFVPPGSSQHSQLFEEPCVNQAPPKEFVDYLESDLLDERHSTDDQLSIMSGDKHNVDEAQSSVESQRLDLPCTDGADEEHCVTEEQADFDYESVSGAEKSQLMVDEVEGPLSEVVFIVDPELDFQEHKVDDITDNMIDIIDQGDGQQSQVLQVNPIEEQSQLLQVNHIEEQSQVLQVNPTEENIMQSSQDMFGDLFATQVLRNIPIPSNLSGNRDQSHAMGSQDEFEFDDPMISTQDLGKIQMTQFNELARSERSRIPQTVQPLFQPGPTFGTASGAPIHISKESEIYANIFLQDQADSCTRASNGAALLRKVVNSSNVPKNGAKLHIPTLADKDSLLVSLKTDDFSFDKPKDESTDSFTGNVVLESKAPPGSFSGPSKAFISPVLGSFSTSSKFQSPVISDAVPRQSIQPPSVLAGFSNASAPFISPIVNMKDPTSPDATDALSVSFQTASNKKLLPPSGFSNASTTFISPMIGLPAPEPADELFGGFQTASKKKLAIPSAAARAKALEVLNLSKPSKADVLLQDFEMPDSEVTTCKTNTNDYEFKAPLPGITASRSVPETPRALTRPPNTPSSSAVGVFSNALLTPSVTPMTTPSFSRTSSSSARPSSVRSGVKNTPFRRVTINPLNFSHTPQSSLPLIKTFQVDSLVTIPESRISYAEAFKNQPSREFYHGPWSQVINQAYCDYSFDSGNEFQGVFEAFSLLRDTVSAKISLDWVRNHYRWILWKLASLASKFEGQASRWNFDEVITQLKFRYDVEENQTRRSVIKLIVEKDESEKKHMVLFVSCLRIAGDQVEKVMLSDGWYELTATLDKPLSFLAITGKLFLGQKLHIQGAHLAGLNDACTPLELPASASLKICRNGVRRAKWDALLGFQKLPIFPVALHTLCHNGGNCSLLDVVITRKYPVLPFQRQSDDGSSDGGNFKSVCIYRSAQEEAEEQRQWFRRHELAYANAEKEFEKDPTSLDVRDQRNRQEVHEALMRQADEQVPRRNCQYSCDLRVCDYLPNGLNLPSPSTTLQEAVITVTSPSEEYFDQFKEGLRFKIGNVTSYQSSAGPIELRFNRNTFMSPQPISDSSNESPRWFFPFERVLASSCASIDFSHQEFDACLVILDHVSIGSFVKGPQKVFQYLILLTDESLNKVVVQAEFYSDKEKMLIPKIAVLLLNMERCRFQMEGATKFTLSPRRGAISTVPIPPFSKTKRLSQLKTWVDSGGLPQDLLADSQVFLERFKI